MKLSRMLVLWGPVVAWMGVIFSLSAIPSLSTHLGIWDFILRKIAHMAEFAILFLLLVRALRLSWPVLVFRWVLILSGAAALLYAVSDEFHQSFVPGRTASVLDVSIDFAGILIAVLFAKSKMKPSGIPSSNSKLSNNTNQTVPLPDEGGEGPGVGD